MDKLNLKDDGSFIQEFVDDPLLIDGYKFDIGVYTMITSIDPLRIYVFEGTVTQFLFLTQYSLKTIVYINLMK